MATFYLINPVTVAGAKMLPGTFVDSAVNDVAAIQAAGGLLWPSSDPTIAAAAAKAQQAARNKGSNEQALESIMQTAVQKVQQQDENYDESPVANPTALSAVEDTPLVDNSERFVNSLKTSFRLDKASTATPDGVTVLATLSGTGRWMRLSSPSTARWADQTDWYVDPAAGSDARQGNTPAAAVQTLAEVCRRLTVVNPGFYNINVTGNVPASDVCLFQAQLNVQTGAGSTVIFLYGGDWATELYANTVTSATLTDAPTNAQGTLTKVGAPWSTSIGKLLFMYDGALGGYHAFVLKDLGGGVARVSEWVDENGIPAGAVPDPGDTFAIFDLVSIACPISAQPANGITYFLQDFDLKLVEPVGAQTMAFFESTFTGSGATRVRLRPARGGVLQLQGCCIHPTALRGVEPTAGQLIMIGTSLINCEVRPMSLEADTQLTDCNLQGSWIHQGRGISATNGVYASTLKLSKLVGIFDPPAGKDSITLQKGALAFLTGSLYGSGGTADGVDVRTGATLMIVDTFTPTLTAAGQEVKLAGGATAIPELAAGAAVPAASALTTWANWAAAPFSRNVMDYKSGSKIITTPLFFG